MILTIAIPTYNRPEKLARTILALIPQINDQVKILILDNCSEIIISEYLKQFISQETFSNISVVRHITNIGPDANFSRCFELCDTPYIWTLGDDDNVKDNAVQLILHEINTYNVQQPLGFNFFSNCLPTPRNEPVFIKSTDDLVNKLDAFGNWLFISTNVYHTISYLKYLRYAAWGSYSMASQLIPAMVAISDGELFILSEKHIVDNVKAKEIHDKWSDFQLGFTVPNLLETPIRLKKDEFYIFGKKLAFHFDYIWPLSVIYIILKSIDFKIDRIDNYHIYLYEQFFSKTFPFRSQKAAQYRQYYICLFFLKNKSLLTLLLKIRPGIKTRAGRETPFNLFIR